MDVKDFLTKKGLELFQDPRVSKMMQDERVLKGLMRAFEVRGRLQSEFDEQVERLAKTMGLATQREVRQLKRTIRRMEGKLDKAKARPATVQPTDKTEE